MRRYPILWHEGTLSHRFSVCVEVGKVILTLPGLDARCYGLHSACRGGLLHTDPQEQTGNHHCILRKTICVCVCVRVCMCVLC